MPYLGFSILPRSVFWSADFVRRSDNLDVIRLKRLRMRTANIVAQTLALCPLLPMLLILLVRTHSSPASDELGMSAVAQESLCDKLEHQFDLLPAMSLQSVEGILADARRAKRAVIFLNVQWSPNALAFRSRYTKSIPEYYANSQDRELLFYVIDCTNRVHEPFEEIPGWEAANRYGNPVYHGNGGILWLENGNLISLKSVLDFKDPSELAQYTKSIFESA